MIVTTMVHAPVAVINKVEKTRSGLFLFLLLFPPFAINIYASKEYILKCNWEPYYTVIRLK